MLTLKPKSWTLADTMNCSDATRHMVRTAINVRKKHGVLVKPSRAARKSPDKPAINSATCFYENDEISGKFPEAKDYVSVAYKVHHQK